MERPSAYRIRVRGRLDPEWSAWFDGLALRAGWADQTCLEGPLADQAALHGILARIRDLGLQLVSLERIEQPEAARGPVAPTLAEATASTAAAHRLGGDDPMNGTTFPATRAKPAGDSDVAITVSGLRKRYGDYQAVRGLELRVRTGEVFAFLGPNGAGKTTTVEILEGYRRRDAGEVRVLGLDPAHPTLAWRARIGLVLQASRMPAELTVRELVERYAGYYPRPRGAAETIALVGLTDKQHARAGSLSGGQIRRLDVALALVGDPELLFLDEPTTGLDPAARRQAWHLVTSLKALGKTVFLTTHAMDEAEALADRVAIIVAGQIVAEGTPETLGGRADAPAEIRFRRPAGMDPGAILGAAARTDDGWVAVRTPEPTAALGTLADWCREHRLTLAGLEVRRPSLEDIYLELVGGTAR